MADNYVEASLNAQELESIRNKLVQLQDTLGFFFQSVNPDYVPNLSWQDVISKFNILVAKFVIFNNDLASSPRYKKLYVHPYEAPGSDQEAHVLGYLLRTKQIPEIEKQEQAVLNEFLSGGLVETDETSLLDSDSRALGDILSRWQTRVNRHDALCEKAQLAFDRCKDKYQVKTQLKEQEHNQIQDDSPLHTDSNLDSYLNYAYSTPLTSITALTPPKAKSSTSSTVNNSENNSPSPPPSSPSSRNQNTSKSLDQMLGWMSSGRRFNQAR